VRIPLSHRQILMPCQLHRPHRCPSHHQVRTERVPQDVDAGRHLRPVRRIANTRPCTLARYRLPSGWATCGGAAASGRTHARKLAPRAGLFQQSSGLSARCHAGRPATPSATLSVMGLDGTCGVVTCCGRFC